MRLIGRLPRAIQMIIAATILMPASYGVRLGPTLREADLQERSGRPGHARPGQPVAVTGTEFEARPPSPCASRVGQSSDSRDDCRSQRKPRLLLRAALAGGELVLETLGADDFGLAAASLPMARRSRRKGNYFAGEAAGLAGAGWPSRGRDADCSRVNPSICPDRRS